MKRSVFFFYIAAAIAALCLLLAVYYMISGIYHPFVAYSDGAFYLVDPAKKPHFVNSSHHVYAAGFFVLALIFAFFAFLFRRKKAVRMA
jgi:hypothetical protein